MPWLEPLKGKMLHRRTFVNVDYAKHWLHTELRFYDVNSGAVTKHPKPLKQA